MKLVILDAGHAEKVLGKEAPDSSFREWKFNDEMQYLLKEKLEKLGFIVYLTNPNPKGKNEMGLTLRANKANDFWRNLGKPKALFYSIHANAFLKTTSAGRYINEFTSARGTVTFKAKNASTSSCKAAEIFQEEIVNAIKQIDPTGNFKRGVWTENFTVIYKAQMPSILMEYAFYTNEKDLKILKNNKEELADATVKAFCKYFDVPSFQSLPQFVKVIYAGNSGNLNIRDCADWNAKPIGTVKVGEIFTIAERVHAKNGSTDMYKLKSGAYITTASKYVETF